MAEEVATVDNISRGRLDLGIGRSGFTRFYEGYDLPYGESRERFGEYLEVMRLAWTEERFSHQGKYFTFQDVCLTPKPYQRPHPPMRAAATTAETFPLMGGLGLPIFVGLRGMTVSELAPAIEEYRASWRAAGHPGNGDVLLRIPTYVGDSMERALSEPEASTVHAYARLRESLATSVVGRAGTVSGEERAERLANTTYEDLLRERLAYGTPEAVVERLGQLQEDLGLSGVTMEANVGGRIPQDMVLNSIRLFGQEVAPGLR